MGLVGRRLSKTPEQPSNWCTIQAMSESHTVSALLLFALKLPRLVAFKVTKSPFSFLPISMSFPCFQTGQNGYLTDSRLVLFSRQCLYLWLSL